MQSNSPQVPNIFSERIPARPFHQYSRSGEYYNYYKNRSRSPNLGNDPADPFAPVESPEGSVRLGPSAQSLTRKMNRILSKIKEGSVSNHPIPKVINETRKESENTARSNRDKRTEPEFIHNPINTTAITVDFDASLARIKSLTANIRQTLAKIQASSTNDPYEIQSIAKIQPPIIPDRYPDGPTSVGAHRYSSSAMTPSNIKERRTLPTADARKSDPNFVTFNTENEQKRLFENNNAVKFIFSGQNQKQDPAKFLDMDHLDSHGINSRDNYGQRPPSNKHSKSGSVNVDGLSYDQILALKNKINKRLLDFLEGNPKGTPNTPQESRNPNPSIQSRISANGDSNSVAVVSIDVPKGVPPGRFSKAKEPQALEETDQSLLEIEREMRGEISAEDD